MISMLLMSGFASVMKDALIPICVCVVLPILLVWIISRTRSHEVDRRTDVMLASLEKGAQFDPNLFAKESRKQNHSLKERIYKRLQGGLILLFISLCALPLIFYAGLDPEEKLVIMMPFAILAGIGLALLISFYVMKKNFAEECKAETEADK